MAHPILIAAGAAFAGALLLTPLAGALARVFRVLDAPGGLKTHARAVPYLGGVAIFLAWLGSLLFVGPGTGPSLDWMQAIMGGAGALLILGLVDDIRPVPIPLKLLWEGLVGMYLIAKGIKIFLFPWEPLNNLVSLLWLVGMTNALNLVDIMDGLAGTIALGALAAFALLAHQHGLGDAALLSGAAAGAVAGFLAFNWPPARIFLGDAGSLQLGFLLGSLAMAARYTSRHQAGFAAPLIILLLPLTETAFLIWQRRRQGKPAMWGSPDHMALRMERQGWPRPRILHLTVLATLSLCLTAFGVVWLPLWAAGALLAALAASLFWLVRWMHRHP